MSAFTYDKLRIESGSFGLQRLENLSIKIDPNDHAHLKFSGVMHSDKTLAALREAIANTKISLIGFDEAGEALEEPIFCGIVHEIGIVKENTYYYVEVEAISGTYQLDREKKSRSFQNVQMTYSAVVETVLKDTKAAGVVFPMEEADVPIEKPLIQYEETDWAFIRRLASRLNSMLIPNFLTDHPIFFFGMKKGRQAPVFDEEKYRMKVDGLYYVKGGAETEQRRAYYIHYMVSSTQNYDIGCRCVYQGMNFIICKKEAEMRKGELCFTYCLGQQELVRLTKYYNDKICGMCLPGVVLATEKELVKLHLYIDKQQDTDKAYFYQWVPKTGNLMYCMPEVGSNVSLYMGSRDEQSALVIDSIRVNGSTCPNLEVCKNRYLTTKYHKRFYTTPVNMGLLSDTRSDLPLSMKLDDYSGIQIQSHKGIDIQADEKIDIQAPIVSLDAPLQISLHQATASLEINNQFNICANIGVVEGPKLDCHSISIDSSGEDEKLLKNKLADTVRQEEAVVQDIMEPREAMISSMTKKMLLGTGLMPTEDLVDKSSVPSIWQTMQDSAALREETISSVTKKMLQGTGLRLTEDLMDTSGVQAIGQAAQDLTGRGERIKNISNRFDWCKQAGFVLSNNIIAAGEEKLAELFARACGPAGAAGAMVVLNAAKVGTVNIPAIVVEQMIKGIKINPGGAMAIGAKGARVPSVSGATPALNPALPPQFVKNLKDRAMADFMKAAVIQTDYAIKPYRARVINRGCFGGEGKSCFLDN